MLLTVLAFLFAIGFLVTIHEYGHYRVAKACGVKVLTFSIGFGRPLLQWQRGETRWQIAAIPLGGYVRMLGEDEDAADDAAEPERQFNRQSPLRKMAIVAAGPAANLLLACLLFMVAYMMGVDTLRPVAGSVREGSPAAAAGLRSGDEIIRMGSHDVQEWNDLRLALLDAGEGAVELTVRGVSGAERSLRLDPGQVQSRVDENILAGLGLSPAPLLNRIDAIEPGSVAALAGLRQGDEIFAIDDVPVNSWERLQRRVAQSPARELRLSVRRSADQFELVVVPAVVETAEGRIGRLGIAPQVDAEQFARQQFLLQLGPVAAFQKSLVRVWELSVTTLKLIGRMLTGELSSRHVSGPIGIASMAGESAGMGISPYLQYLGLVSLSLGLLNLLPVPVLDGGHLLYHGAELVRGKPLPVAWQAAGQRIGIVLLVALMLLALYNDIHRFIPG